MSAEHRIHLSCCFQVSDGAALSVYGLFSSVSDHFKVFFILQMKNNPTANAAVVKIIYDTNNSHSMSHRFSTAVKLHIMSQLRQHQALCSASSRLTLTYRRLKLLHVWTNRFVLNTRSNLVPVLNVAVGLGRVSLNDSSCDKHKNICLHTEMKKDSDVHMSTWHQLSSSLWSR